MRPWANKVLFVGHEATGENLAGLYALVATFEAIQINPEEYLANVLLRVQTHANSRSSELLPTSGSGDATPSCLLKLSSPASKSSRRAPAAGLVRHQASQHVVHRAVTERR